MMRKLKTSHRDISIQPLRLPQKSLINKKLFATFDSSSNEKSKESIERLMGVALCS